MQDVSYPFLIQANYRAGYFTHYAGEGTVRSCRVTCGGETADLCLTRTKARFSREGNVRVVTAEPTELILGGVRVTVQSVFRFPEGTGRVETERRVLSVSEPGARVRFDEYVTACYGTTEYPEDMTGIVLTAGEESLTYAYRCRALEGKGTASAVIGAIGTKVSLTAGEEADCYAREGYAFSPMFTLGAKGTISEKESFTSWLSLEKAN